MNSMDLISTRDAFGHTLCELGAMYKNLLVLDAQVSGGTRSREFRKLYPERHINCGIAEANMVCIAAGVASTGVPVIVSGFAIFVAGRAYEQIRTSLGYTNLPVVIGATHAGITTGKDGATHQCTEDIALMRSIPGMTVICPSDSLEASIVLKAAVYLNRPVYIRLSKYPTPIIHDQNYKFTIGKGEKLVNGDDVTLLATGTMVHEAIQASKILHSRGISARVINISTIKPIDKEIILEAAHETKVLLTIEEHSVIGGLGDAVSEVVTEVKPVPIYRFGVNDVFGQSGSAAELLELYGLSAHNIANKTIHLLNAVC